MTRTQATVGQTGRILRTLSHGHEFVTITGWDTFFGADVGVDEDGGMYPASELFMQKTGGEIVYATHPVDGRQHRFNLSIVSDCAEYNAMCANIRYHAEDTPSNLFCLAGV